MHVSFRISDQIGKRVVALAAAHKIKPSEMWRILVLRGLDAESALMFKYTIESLCIARHLAASVNMDLLVNAQNDADSMMEKLGVGGPVNEAGE